MQYFALTFTLKSVTGIRDKTDQVFEALQNVVFEKSLSHSGCQSRTREVVHRND